MRLQQRPKDFTWDELVALFGGDVVKDMMSYKGYLGSVHYDDEERTFHGKLEFIRSLISYEGTTVDNLRRAFEEAVDDYLDLCSQEGIEAEQPFKGSFNVRTGPDLHRRAALLAQRSGTTLNQVVAEALERYLAEQKASLR